MAHIIMKSFRFSGKHPNKSQIPQKNPAAECMIMGLEYQGIDITKLRKPKKKVIGFFNGLEVYKYEDEDAIPSVVHGNLFPLVSYGIITKEGEKSYNINVEKAIRYWESTPAHISLASYFSTIDWNNWEW